MSDNQLFQSIKYELSCDSLRANEIYGKINGPSSNGSTNGSTNGPSTAITGTTGYFQDIDSIRGQIDEFNCATGVITNFFSTTSDIDTIYCNNLYAATGIDAKDITATGNISGATGIFENISAIGTISGATGSFGNISATGPISGDTGSFRNISATGTGSFENINATGGRFRNIEISHANSNVIVPNNGGLYAYGTNNDTYQFNNGTYTIITNTNVQGGTIPVSSLLEGSTYEVYFSGLYFGISTPFSVDLNLTFFSTPQITDSSFAPINLNPGGNGWTGEYHFVVRFIFRIVSLTIGNSQEMKITSNTTSTVTTAIVPSVTLTFSETKNVTTPDRDSVSVKEFPINIQMKGNSIGKNIYERNYYVRRIV
jgi:hypothetical protein